VQRLRKLGGHQNLSLMAVSVQHDPFRFEVGCRQNKTDVVIIADS